MDQKQKVLGIGSGGSGLFIDTLEDQLKYIELNIKFNKVKISGMFGMYLQDGKLYYWGQSTLFSNSNNKDIITQIPRQIQLQKQVKQFSCGWQHALILTQDYQLFGFGSNKFGQLGSDTQIQNQVVQINTDLHPKKIRCGFRQSFLITEENQLYGCGQNRNNELAVSNNQMENKFIQIMVDVVRVKCGQKFVLALSQNDDLYGWGHSNYGQVDQNKIHKLTSMVKDFDTGWSHQLVLRYQKPYLLIRGRDDMNQKGNLKGSKTYDSLDDQFSQKHVKRVKCGSESSYVICDEGIYGCGWNEHGNLIGEDKFIKEFKELQINGKIKCKGAFSLLIE